MKKISLLLLLFYCSISMAKKINCQIKFLSFDNDTLKCSVLQSKFQEIPQSESLGLKNGNYWFKVIIKSIDVNKIIVEIPTHNIEEILIYKRKGNSLLYVNEIKNNYNLQQNKQNRFPNFSVDIENNTTEIFLKVFFCKEANFPLRIYTTEEYFEHTFLYNLFTGTYYGFLLAILICNLFFYIKFNEKVYLYYLIFLCSYTVAILYHDGTMNLILPINTIIDIEGISHLLTEITMFLFSFTFLNFKDYVPKFKRYAIGLVTLMSLLEISHIVTGDFIFYIMADTVAMSSFSITWIVCVVYMGEVKFARFYILGYTILITFGFHFLFSYDFGLIPNNGQTFFLKLASMIDMLIFTYAISYRLDILNKEHKKQISELQLLLSKNQKGTSIDSFYILLEENELSNTTLTLQEIKVLKCIHERMTNREIAEKLFVSTNTIKFHVSNIYKKLDVKSRNEVNEKLTEFNKN
ncbi:7TMR-DISM extracellular protein 2 [Kordia periserrulae]|uniref:7TMR-DISM extracellular protein 2 n=1 Tax=Kordia periserrulae TaxID=701523 RepID=A0A2T6BTQ6_9FLAO|nr:7TM diverse intracellular signaling domain-containing protein [Kordia periserrulae]PTX59460.1 7TMR-DISM extracellular protein 2 [Kordia periserrulae]